MNKILKTILYILLILLIAFAGFAIYKAIKWMEPDPGLILPPGSFDWDPLPPITLPPGIATNPAASNAAHTANQFLTNKPWIIASNGRIYAGLYKREWSISYEIKNPLLHEVGIIIGGVNGLYYRFNPIGKLTVGGVVVWDGEELAGSGTIGWKF